MIYRLCLILALLCSAPAFAFDTQARAAWVYDVTSQTVLMDKNADEALPPASMSKLMTVNMLFEALRDKRVAMDDRFAVSSYAKSMGGSTMFLNELDRPTVQDLIHGIIVNSGNDACVVVAEGLAGSEAAFARQMNERARALGMTNSRFANASGWPDPEHRMSMRDLGVLATRLITEFPEYYEIFAQTEFNYANRAAANRFNRNPLLKLNIGADGLKTGHTQEAGYGLVGSAQQDGRRIVFALTGLPSEKARAEESERIVQWAFRQFTLKTIAKAGTRLGSAEVWMGDSSQVGLVPRHDLLQLLPAQAQENIKAEIIYTGPIEAPIAKDQEIAKLVLHIPDMPDKSVPLVAETAVEKGGLGTGLITAAQVLFSRFFGSGAQAG